jgi:hypothetical protein
MEDGTVLRNYGAGWKVFGKVKSDTSPQQAADRAAEFDRTASVRRPAFVAYRKLLHDLVGFSGWYRVNEALGLMPDDADGVWSTLDDEHDLSGQLSLEDVEALLAARKSSIEEGKERLASKSAA